jgi:acetyltransferase-like isoleucine patch superfamily enzyme
MTAARKIPWDWYDGTIPQNVSLDDTAHIETAFSFTLYRSRLDEGLVINRGASVYNGTMFDVGVNGRVIIGAYTMMNEARIICDKEVEIGSHTLIAWNVVIMDTYRVPLDPSHRRSFLHDISWRNRTQGAGADSARRVSIGANVWVGFDCCILPGVTIGNGSVIGARSVVASDIPPFTVAAGNPARVLRRFSEEEIAQVKSQYADYV